MYVVFIRVNLLRCPLITLLEFQLTYQRVHSISRTGPHDVRLNLMLFHWWFSLREVPVTASTAQVLQWIVIDDRQISCISIFLFINMNFSDIFIQTDWLASRDVVTSCDLPLISWGRPRPFWLTAKNLKAYPHKHTAISIITDVDSTQWHSEDIKWS